MNGYHALHTRLARYTPFTGLLLTEPRGTGELFEVDLRPRGWLDQLAGLDSAAAGLDSAESAEGVHERGQQGETHENRRRHAEDTKCCKRVVTLLE